MRRTYYTLAAINAALVLAAVYTGYRFQAIGFLTYDWWFWFMKVYSITALAILGFVVFSIKLAAIINPKIPSNAIVDLITETFGTTGSFPEVPGGGKK